MCSVGSGSVGARGSTRCETEKTGQIELMLGELFGIATNEAPLLVDTVAVTEEGLY